MKKAFGLMELVIGMAVLLILAAIAVPVYKNYSGRVIFTSARAELDSIIRKSMLNLAVNGKCNNSYVTLDSSHVLAAYRIMTAVTPYEGCMVSGYFKSVENGGHANFSDKVVRLHYAREEGAPPSALFSYQCFTNISAEDAGATGAGYCMYSQDWVTKEF